MKFIKTNVIGQMKHFSDIYSEEDIALSNLGITKHFISLFRNSRSLIFSYLFLKENVTLMDVEYIFDENIELYHIVKDYKKELFTYKEFIDKVLVVYFDIKFTYSSKTNYKKNLVELLREFKNKKTNFSFIDKIPFKNAEKVFFGLLTFKLINEKSGNDFYYIREFVILFLVKFQINSSYNFFNCYDYENEECFKEVVLLINCLEDYVYSINRIEENEVTVILDFLNGMNSFDIFKNDFDFQRRINNLQLNLFSKLDSEFSFGFIEENCPSHVLIELISRAKLYETSSSYLNLYLETYGVIFDKFQSNMIDLKKLVKNASFHLTTVQTVASILNNSLIAEEISDLIEGLTLFIENSHIDNMLFIDYLFELGYYFLMEFYLESKRIKDNLLELVRKIDIDEDTLIVEDTITDMMVVNDYLKDFFYDNSPFIYNTLSPGNLSIYFNLFNKRELGKNLKDNFYEDTNIGYDYYTFQKDVLKDIVVTRLSEMSSSSFYKHRITNINKENIVFSIEDMFQQDHNWLDLLCQAEFLIGFYQKIDSHNFKRNDIDWTFIYVLLVKTAEFLIGNFVEKMLTKYYDNQYEFNIDYNMDKKVKISNDTWRNSLTMKNFQYLIRNYIANKVKNNNDIKSFIKQLNELVVIDRNRYIHGDLITNFNELYLKLKDNVYLTIYRIIEIYVNDKA